MSHKYVYLFTEGNGSMRELLGGKGANLAEMTNIGLPVPQGFTISTEACTQYYEDGRKINDAIQAEIMEYVELREVLTGNVEFAYHYILDHFPGVKLAKPQGTYMLYLDCEEWCKNKGITLDELIKAGIRVGVIWQDGRPFNRPWAIRMNLALPESRVKEAFQRLTEYVFI